MAFVADIVNDALPLDGQAIRQLSQLCANIQSFQDSLPPGVKWEDSEMSPPGLVRLRSQHTSLRFADHHPPDSHPMPPGTERLEQPTRKPTASDVIGLHSRLVAAHLLRQCISYRPVGADVGGNQLCRKHESDHAG